MGNMKNVIECKKWRSLNKNLLVETLQSFQKHNYMLSDSNMMKQLRMLKRTKYNISLITDDEIKLMVSRKSPNKRKYNFPNRQKKLNVSLNICHEENNRNLDYFLFDNKQELWYDSEPSAVVPGFLYIL